MSGRQGAVDAEKLREAGLRATLPRTRILDLLHEKGDHLSVEDIYAALREGGFRMGLATVYRVMSQFERAGLVLRHCFDGTTSVYELAPEDHHDHMLCEDCGRVIEFTEQRIEDLQEEVAAKHGFELVDHALHLHVRCKDSDCEHRRGRKPS